MAYTPTNWKDRVVEKPRTYRMQDNGDGTITLIPEPGTIYEPGTPVNAPNLNKLEQGIADAHTLAENAQATANGKVSKSGDTMTGQLIVPRVFVSASDGAEGGEMELAKPASGTSLAGNVAIDIYGNYIRFFERGGGSRGAKINLTEQANVVGSDIWTTAKLRINNGTLEFFDGGVWKPVGGIKNIQRGTASISGSGGTYTDVVISAVDINKSFAHLNVIGNFTSSIPWQITAKLINSTTLRLTFYHNAGTAGASNLEWEVVEFY